MINKIKAIAEFEQQIISYQKVIDELKNIPEDMVFFSSEPNEKAEDVIKHYEEMIKLAHIAIEKIKLL